MNVSTSRPRGEPGQWEPGDYTAFVHVIEKMTEQQSGDLVDAASYVAGDMNVSISHWLIDVTLAKAPERLWIAYQNENMNFGKRLVGMESQLWLKRISGLAQIH